MLISTFLLRTGNAELLITMACIFSVLIAYFLIAIAMISIFELALLISMIGEERQTITNKV